MLTWSPLAEPPGARWPGVGARSGLLTHEDRSPGSLRRTGWRAGLRGAQPRVGAGAAGGRCGGHGPSAGRRPREGCRGLGGAGAAAGGGEAAREAGRRARRSPRGPLARAGRRTVSEPPPAPPAAKSGPKLARVPRFGGQRAAQRRPTAAARAGAQGAGPPRGSAPLRTSTRPARPAEPGAPQATGGSARARGRDRPGRRLRHPGASAGPPSGARPAADEESGAAARAARTLRGAARAPGRPLPPLGSPRPATRGATSRSPRA
jgi:hypothetical protein